MEEIFIKTSLTEGAVRKIVDLSYKGIHKMTFELNVSLEDILSSKYSFEEQLRRFVKDFNERESNVYHALMELEFEHDSFTYEDIYKKVLHQLAYTFKEKYIKKRLY